MSKLGSLKFMGVDVGVTKHRKTSICVISVTIEEAVEVEAGNVHDMLHTVTDLMKKHNVDTVTIDAGAFNEPVCRELMEIVGPSQKISEVRIRKGDRHGNNISINGAFQSPTAFTSACVAAMGVHHRYLPEIILPPIAELRREGLTYGR
jgi:hypothetical protein